MTFEKKLIIPRADISWHMMIFGDILWHMVIFHVKTMLFIMICHDKSWNDSISIMLLQTLYSPNIEVKDVRYSKAQKMLKFTFNALIQ